MVKVRPVLAVSKHMMAKTLYGISSIWVTVAIKGEPLAISNTPQDPRQLLWITSITIWQRNYSFYYGTKDTKTFRVLSNQSMSTLEREHSRLEIIRLKAILMDSPRDSKNSNLR